MHDPLIQTPAHTMSDQHLVQSSARVVTGASARMASALFNYGNLVAILIPPLGMLWLAASMVLYALNRHHPNPKVGHYTQQAAYRLYGVVGFFVAIAAFIPGGGWEYYLIAWALAVLILVPWSIWDLLRIWRDEWQDIQLEVE